LEDNEYFEETTQKIIDCREWTTTQLEQLGFDVVPSKTNFVFTRHSSLSGAELMSYLRGHNLLVRHFGKPGIENHLRITIGTPDEMRTLIETLKQHPQI
jgi:histidinol-phosphate aminotransferase